jgi:hypothetical protein
MTIPGLLHAARLAAALAALAVTQSAAQTTDSAASYDRAALNIVPRLVALDVVRGAREERVSSLAFLFPHRVTSAFGTCEPAQLHAARAFRLRRVAAALTDAGLVLAVASATRAVSPTGRHFALTAAGAMVAGSVPIHFSADAALSRAVWEYNRQFGR